MKKQAMSWRVVLVRPRNPLNIGAAARAMANFGLTDLVVVSPYEPTWREAKSAVGAGRILKSARAVDCLVKAIGDAGLVVGTTTGRHRTLDRELIPLSGLPRCLEGQRPRRRAALLFGSEKTGLSNEDVSFCHALVRIPTIPECPSMNLGQSVAVCCYELARSGMIAAPAQRSATLRSEPAKIQSQEHLLARAVRLLEAAGYFAPKSRDAQTRKLRRFLFDLELTNYDARILGGVLAQMEWKLKRQGPESEVR